MSEIKIKRCAVYTRKSNEDGLEQEFNSLDSQRESAENYIKSQKDNGWQLLPEHYDDGGYSGGNTERPALKRLMADVKAGEIDIIVVYKMDRLSRSLLDFMNMAEFLEQHNVSFVSVTQDINTSTSSGRMMLNILMTFAQYEREVIAERIRDKIAGAKRRGKYCGGVPVLGYDVNSEMKKLVINPAEAKIVREAFTIYLRIGSSREVCRILNYKGYRSKSWISKKGKHHGGSKFNRKTIYRLLCNPIYAGMVRHNENTYAGEQEAIIDKKLWDKVQHLLRENSNTRPGDRRNPISSPFKGLMVCGYCGGSFGITYTKKKNRHYMYYTCIKDGFRAEKECPLGRFAAGDVDKIILRQLSRILKTPSMLMKLYGELQEREQEQRKELLVRQAELESGMQKIRKKFQIDGDISEVRQQFSELNNELSRIKNELKSLGDVYSTRDLVDTCDSIEAIWDELFPAERYNLAHQLIDKITLYTDHLIMDIKHHGLKSLISELKTDKNIEVYQPENSEIIQLNVPVLVKRWNGRKLIVAPGEGKKELETGECEPCLLAQRLAQAHKWIGMLESGEYSTITQLAEAFGQDRSTLNKTLKMVNLAPEIQKRIVEGNPPESLTLSKFREELPEVWDEQEKMYYNKN